LARPTLAKRLVTSLGVERSITHSLKVEPVLARPGAWLVDHWAEKEIVILDDGTVGGGASPTRSGAGCVSARQADGTYVPLEQSEAKE
jgi:hypothetical protein